jgi:dGTP triphosphohydrolase
MSVEKVKELAQPAAKSNLFERKKIIKVFGEDYIIKRLTRKEMYESGISYLSSLLTSLSRELDKEIDIEKKKQIIQEAEKTQYEFERRLLLNCIEGMTEERLDMLDIDVWRELLSHVVAFNFLTSRKSLGQQEFREESTLATL